MVGPHVLSIDLGTGGPKVALVAPTGAIAASASGGVDTLRLPQGGAEQDPEQIWRAIVDASREVVARAPSAEIAAVALASQFSSVVPVDRHARPTANLILWMDTRGAPYARGIYERHPEAGGRWIELHGALPLPSGNDTLAHVLWLQHERPDVYARTHCFLEAMDFVAARLTGAFTANACTAFMLLLTDNRDLAKVAYADDLIRFAGIDREKLPELVPVGACVGGLTAAAADELGLPAQTPVYSGLNDTQAIAVGSAAFDGRGAVNIGTTSQILAHMDRKESSLEHNLVSAPSAFADRYVVIAENGIGAKALDHFLHAIAFASDSLADHRSADPFARVERALQASPAASDGLLFLPWLAGAQAPAADPHARGGFLNVSLDTTREHMLRAVCEGVALNLRWLLPAVESFSGQHFGELRFSGGGALSDGWSQILADALGRPILQLRDARHAINRALGLLVFEQLGLASLGDLDALAPVKRTYHPREELHDGYERLFEQFVSAFERNRPIFEALNT